MTRRAALAAVVPIAVVLAAVAGCGPGTRPSLVPGGDPERGAGLIHDIGCGSCHRIGGISGANGQVGPSLRDFRNKRFIAGQLPNTPDEVERWIEDPPAIEPKTIMPDLGVRPDQARDIVAYLYTQ